MSKLIEKFINFIRNLNKYGVFVYLAITNFIFIFGTFYFNQHMRRHYLFKIFGQPPKPNYYIMTLLFLIIAISIILTGIFLYTYYTKNEKK